MKRILFMVVTNFFHVVWWIYKIDQMGKHPQRYSEEEKYDYLRKRLKKVNKRGRVQIITVGVEHLPKSGGFLLFPNHQGLFDMLAIIESCPNPLGVVVKKEAAQWVLVKQVVRLLEGISMDRSDIRSSREIINKVADEVKKGRNFVIFPEGTRSRKGNEVLNFKAGTFKSAIKAGCPIIPVALIDSFRPFDLPSIKKETVQVHFLKAIDPEEYMGMKTVEIAEMVRERIQEEINQTIQNSKAPETHEKI